MNDSSTKVTIEDTIHQGALRKHIEENNGAVAGG